MGAATCDRMITDILMQLHMLVYIYVFAAGSFRICMLVPFSQFLRHFAYFE